jgi:hypothetical protein
MWTMRELRLGPVPVLAAAIAATLAVAAGAGAQAEDELRPEASMSDVEIDERAAPLGPPVGATVVGEVECPPASDGDRAGGQATLRAEGSSFLNAIVTPATQTLPAGTDCPPGEMVELDWTLGVSVTQSAPAFEPVQAPLELAATWWVDDRQRTSTASANATLTPGYLAQLDVRLDEKIAEVEPGGQHAFPMQVTSFANGRTDVTVELVEAPEGVSVSVPEGPTLDPEEAADLEVQARDEGEPGDVHAFRVQVTATSAHAEAPPDADTASETASLLLEVQGGDGRDDSTAGASAPGASVLAALAGAGAVAAGARRG